MFHSVARGLFHSLNKQLLLKPGQIQTQRQSITGGISARC